MDNREWWRLALDKVRRFLKWIGPKLLVRALWAGLAVGTVFGLAHAGVIPADKLQAVLTALAAFVGLMN